MFQKINNFCASSRTVLSKTAKSLQSCPTLCNPIDGNPPGSPVPGILQARNPLLNEIFQETHDFLNLEVSAGTQEQSPLGLNTYLFKF